MIPSGALEVLGNNVSDFASLGYFGQDSLDMDSNS